jgi:hypothetical protein
VHREFCIKAFLQSPSSTAAHTETVYRTQSRLHQPSSPRIESSTRNVFFLQVLSTRQPFEYNISTWLILGATLQCVLVAVLPRNIALLPPCALLIFQIIRGFLVANGTLPNPIAKEVVHGRRTWQIPSADGATTSGSSESIVVLVLAASWTHPNGRLSPGSLVMGEYFAAMWADAADNREKYGFLGNTPPLHTQDDGMRQDTKGQIEVHLSYWKTLEGLHNFAHGSAHMKGQLWWDRGANNEFPHIGLSHETYEVLAGNWENIYLNFRPFGISKSALMLFGQVYVANRVQQMQNTLCLLRTKSLPKRANLSAGSMAYAIRRERTGRPCFREWGAKLPLQFSRRSSSVHFVLLSAMLRVERLFGNATGVMCLQDMRCLLERVVRSL